MYNGQAVELARYTEAASCSEHPALPQGSADLQSDSSSPNLCSGHHPLSDLLSKRCLKAAL